MPNILVADDDANNQTLIQRLIRRIDTPDDEVLDVIQASTKGEAIAAIDANEFALVISDIRMPNSQDGISVISYALDKGLTVVVHSGSLNDLPVDIKSNPSVHLIEKGIGTPNLKPTITKILFPQTPTETQA